MCSTSHRHAQHNNINYSQTDFNLSENEGEPGRRFDTTRTSKAESHVFVSSGDAIITVVVPLGKAVALDIIRRNIANTHDRYPTKHLICFPAITYQNII